MNTPPGLRFDRLDALRGVAIVWMAVFHFCFDLNHVGLWEPRQFFTRDPFWTMQRKRRAPKWRLFSAPPIRWK